MNEKITRLYDELKSQSWDGLLVTDPKHIYYLTGFASDPHERFLGLVLLRDQEPELIVPALDAEAAQAASSVTRISTHTDTDNPYDLLRQRTGTGMKAFALEKEHVSVLRYEQLHTAIGAAQYVDLGPVLQEMRVRKTPEEVQRLKHAARLVEDALRHGLTHVREGVTEVELVAEIEYQMKKSVQMARLLTQQCCLDPKQPCLMVFRVPASCNTAICSCLIWAYIPMAMLRILHVLLLLESYRLSSKQFIIRFFARTKQELPPFAREFPAHP